MIFDPDRLFCFRSSAVFFRFRRVIHRFLILTIGVLMAFSAISAEFELKSGETISGNIIGAERAGVTVRSNRGEMLPLIPWSNLTQSTLRALENDPMAAEYVRGLISSGAPGEMVFVERVSRPAPDAGVFSLLFSSVGWLFVLAIYAGSIYAGYEIAVYRGYTPTITCIGSAVVPVLAPIAFLAIPRHMLIGSIGVNAMAENTSEAQEAAMQKAEELKKQFDKSAMNEDGTVALPSKGKKSAQAAAAEAAAAAPPPPPAEPAFTSYLRGKVSFNRRFFETKLKEYAQVSLPPELQGKPLIVKTTRGQYEVARFARLEQQEVALQVNKGDGASHEVQVPYIEIQEVLVPE